MRIRILSAIFLVLGAQACADDAKDQTAATLRTVEEGVLRSAANPAMSFTPAEGFDYAGDLSVTLKDTALAERHHWVVADGKQIKKLLVVQFESLLDGVDGEYTFAVPTAEEDRAGSNYKFSPEPIQLGGVGFVHNTWALDHTANARENPGMEGEATLALLARQDYEIEDSLIMSRFVQAFGNDNRHELIIFYFEPLSVSGMKLDAFPDGGPPTSRYDAYSDAVTRRSLESFTVDFDAQ